MNKHIIPYYILLFSAITLFFLSFFSNQETLDYHIHATVFIISFAYFLRAVAFVLLIFWVIYKISYKILLSINLTWIHIICTVLLLILILIAGYLNTFPESTDADLKSINRFQIINKWISIFFSSLLLLQLLFLINIIGGLFIKRER